MSERAARTAFQPILEMMFGVIAPTFAKGSLKVPQFGVNAGGFGVADMFVQPITLGWKLKRANLWVADGFVAPTGRYTPGATDDIGSGYWGNQIMTGTTVYLTTNKGTSANLFTDWEQHGSRAGTNNTNLTPGQTFTMEWGIAQGVLFEGAYDTLAARRFSAITGPVLVSKIK